jgi:hypothetical protein
MNIWNIYPDRTKNDPPKWATYEEVIGRLPLELIGFPTTKSELNRFKARYRFAKAYRGLKLDGYTDETAKGYEALLKVFLTWSAFERFLDSIGKKQQDLGELLERYEPRKWMARIREIDEGDRFYKFIYERVNDNHKKELDTYFKDDVCNITYLASAVRHIFSHGCLTPNANQTKPEAVEKICELLYRFHMKVMDAEFSSRISEGERILNEL